VTVEDEAFCTVTTVHRGALAGQGTRRRQPNEVRQRL